MANAVVVALGQVNGAGLTDALFLKLFAGEVLSAFTEMCVTMDKHKIRNITTGKSATFPATWKMTAFYHTPGTEVNGQASNINERVINIDDLLIAPAFIANIDEAKNHFEVRAEYTRQCGIALANQWDKNVLQVGVLAASASATVTGGFGGTTLTSATTLYRTSATDLAAGIYAAAQTLAEKDVPIDHKRYCFVRPAQYYLIAQSTALQSRDFSTTNQMYDKGQITQIAGIPIVMNNHLPIIDLTASQNANMKNTYNADFSKVAALVMAESAVGTVKLMDLSVESEYQIQRQGTLIVAKYAVGTGILRPEAAVVLKTTT